MSPIRTGQFVVATHNDRKFQELNASAGGMLTLVPCPYNSPIVQETADSYEGNARLKAVAISRFFRSPTIGDDTGIEVDAIGGEPGVFSARYAGHREISTCNCRKLLKALRAVPAGQRTARYRTVLVAHWPDGQEVVSQGVCEGRIASTMRGELGFGYQVLFIPTDGDGRTLAEMTLEQRTLI